MSKGPIKVKITLYNYKCLANLKSDQIHRYNTYKHGNLSINFDKPYIEDGRLHKKTLIQYCKRNMPLILYN